jgi:1-acyl-sn-glycerol-3-phosphate acyltransferase
MIVGLFRSILFWFLFLGTTATLHIITALLQVYCKFTGKKDGRLLHSAILLWPDIAFELNPWIKINMQGTENLPPKDEACVIIANHESAADILIIYKLKRQFRWLAKKEAFSIPFIGATMSWIGYVPVDRGNRASHAQAMESSRQWLEQGVSMFFFPEGTRSRTGQVKPFKIGAFRLARQSGKKILPIVLYGTQDILPKRGFYMDKAHITMKILPVIDFLEHETDEQMCARAQKIISDERSALGSIQQPS